MYQPTYQVWFLKYKASWYKLRTEEPNKLKAQEGEALKQASSEHIIRQYIYSKVSLFSMCRQGLKMP